MTPSLKRVFAALAALMIAAPYAALYADSEPPKDCKMKPEDPRCKDDRKY